jgi:hypothetical protein
VDRTAAITTPPGPGSLDASLAVNVTAHKKRLWFVPVASTDLYYLDTEAVEGTAHKFPVGSLLKRGGYIMAMGTYSVDAGEGMDDLFVAISSEGEVIIYSGTDPASATLWQLVGVYHVGDPLGRRSLFQAGGDLMMIIEHGVVPISTALKMDKAVLGEKAATKNIKQAYVDAVARARLAQGWEICSFPLHNMALVNVPGTGSSPIQQFVFNTTTGAWALFEGYNARCWAEYQGHLHFGTDDGRVMHGEHGANDDGAPIILKMLPAFNHLKSPGRIKHVNATRPGGRGRPRRRPVVSVGCHAMGWPRRLVWRTGRSALDGSGKYRQLSLALFPESPRCRSSWWRFPVSNHCSGSCL